MSKIGETTETARKQESHETTHEISRSAEKSSEEFREQMLKKSQEEVKSIKIEGAKEMTHLEERAEREGLEIDGNDKTELQALSKEAEEVRQEFETESKQEDISDFDVKENIKTKSVCPNCGKEGGGGDNFCMECGARLEKIQVRVCLGCGKENKMGNKFCEDCGNKLEKKATEENGAEEVVNGLEKAITQPPLSEEYLSKLPPPIPQEYRAEPLVLPNVPPPLPEMPKSDEEDKKNNLAMKDRIVESPELLSEKEASKRLLSEERIKLAQEIREQRNAQGRRLFRLKNVFEIGQEKIEGEQGDKQLGRLFELQSSEANLMAKRISSEELNDQDTGTEKENMNQLIENSEKLKSIKEKIKEHYEKAGEISRERFDTLNRSLEHVIKRNNAFLVHTLTETEGVRHNENSNVSSEATIEDDIDMLLSLEPSISASSVISGKPSSLWAGGQMGFLLGGGQIGEAGHGDLGTHPDGIKGRKSAGGKDASIEEIDEVVGRDKGRHGGMNEVVVHNTEVAGFFQSAEMDENGRFWIYSLNTKRHAEKVEQEKKRDYLPQPYTKILKGNLSRFSERLSMAEKRGIPQYIMTPNREFFECLGVNEDGSVNIGKQLTPEDVATGRAGLSVEKRKELGERVLEKKIFKKQETIEEAKEIVNSL